VFVCTRTKAPFRYENGGGIPGVMPTIRRIMNPRETPVRYRNVSYNYPYTSRHVLCVFGCFHSQRASTFVSGHFLHLITNIPNTMSEVFHGHIESGTCSKSRPAMAVSFHIFITLFTLFLSFDVV
jgi:hypothetical protein